LKTKIETKLGIVQIKVETRPTALKFRPRPELPRPIQADLIKLYSTIK